MWIADRWPMNADIPSAVDLSREPDFRLGELEARPSRRELVTTNERTFLEPRVMQVLVALARRRGEVLSRDALISSCWEGRIVGDDAINACVAKVRRVGETTGAYAIETIPRVGYRLMASSAPVVEAPVSDEVLLAVLPFENLSDDPRLSYFSDGVSEEILQTLAQRAGLKVIGRSSSFQFRGADKAIPNVAARLNATHVLDGAVRRSGQRMRISAQLIECATQTTVWADRFERELSDIFALQDEVAAAVAHAMRCALSPAVRSGAVDPIAYDLYLRGNRPLGVMGTGYHAQLAQLEEAVQRAPDFAEAWASLGHVRASRAFYVAGAEAGPLRQQAQAAALHALELDPQCGLAAAVMAQAIPVYDAVADHGAWITRAIHLAPDNAIISRLYSRMLSAVGRSRESLALVRRANRLDPLDLHAVAMLGRTLFENGALDEAVAVLEGARGSWDQLQLLPLWMALTLGLMGDLDRMRQVQSQYDLGPYASILAEMIDIHFDPTQQSGERLMARLREQAREGRVTIDLLASAAQRGHVDEVFEIAGRSELGPSADEAASADLSTSNLAMLFMQPMYAIRSDRRFVDLCARLGLVDYWLATDVWPDCVEEAAPLYDFKPECLRAAEAARKALS